MSDPENSVVILDKASEASLIEKIVKRVKQAADENREGEERARQVAQNEELERQEKADRQRADDLEQTTTDALNEIQANPRVGLGMVYRALYGERKREAD